MEGLRNYLLIGHSYFRWLIVIMALSIVIRAFLRLVVKDPWRDTDTWQSLLYIIGLDVQALMGIMLWVTDLMLGGVAGTGAKKLFEHPTIMIVAIGLAHMGHKLQVKHHEKTNFEGRARRGIILLAISALLLGLGVWRMTVG